MSMCLQSFACQQTWRPVGEMRCYIRAHTRQAEEAVALMRRAYWSQGGKQPLVPDVDCKYPAVVYTTHVGAGLSPRHLSFPFFLSFYEILVEFSCFLTVYIHIGRCTLNLWRRMMMMSLGVRVLSLTPYMGWWRRIDKRNVMNGCLFEHVECSRNKTKMFKRL